MDETTTQQENSNLCQQCGGTRRIVYTMGFEEGRPRDLRADPPTFLKLCPGHPAQTEDSQEETLSNEQRYSILKLKQRIVDHFLAEIEAFYTVHPGLRITWDFTIDAFTREEKGEKDS
ncbi:MAG TPA: hypothetical protein VHV10_05170 [Ktedonobacteraceae bacterium]|jgi:hypothetical protein|nr:hypothetical protein [Ktedonobacteraceae bacterium]